LLRERGGDGACEAVPAQGFFAQALAAGGGERVELGAAIVLGGAPVCFQQPLADEAKESGVERALFDEQCVAGDLADAQEDAVSVKRTERDGAQDEQVEVPGRSWAWSFMRSVTFPLS